MHTNLIRTAMRYLGKQNKPLVTKVVLVHIPGIDITMWTKHKV